jgi:membrane protein DedA with SNARE-associated domain
MLLLGGIGLPVPEDVTLILAGFLVSQELITATHAVIVVYPGLLIADSLLYTFGRRFGRAFVEHKRFRRLLPAEKLAELERKFQSKGPSVILFGRYVAGLRVQLFLAAGVLRLPYRKFLLADAISALVPMSVMMGIGYAGGNSLQIILKDVKRIEHVAVVVVIAAVTVFLLVRYFRGRKKET